MPETLVLLARIGLGAVFVAAGAAKLIDRAEFEKHLPAFGVKWPPVARSMSYVLPLAEVVIGTLLIVGLLPNVAASAALILLLLFTLVVAVALVRRTPVSCGCFGNIGQGTVTRMTLGRNFILLSMASTLIIKNKLQTISIDLLPQILCGVMASLTLLLLVIYYEKTKLFLRMPEPLHRSPIVWETES